MAMASSRLVEGSGMMAIHPSGSPFGFVPEPAIVEPSSDMLHADKSLHPDTSRPRCADWSQAILDPKGFARIAIEVLNRRGGFESFYDSDRRR